MSENMLLFARSYVEMYQTRIPTLGNTKFQFVAIPGTRSLNIVLLFEVSKS